MELKANDDSMICSWMRNFNEVEFWGNCEQVNNPDFNSIEFEGIKNEAGLNSFHRNPWHLKSLSVLLAQRLGEC